MKLILNGFAMSIGMFSVLPTLKKWNENAVKYMILTFPFVGLLIGVLWYTVYKILCFLNVPLFIFAAIIMMFPLFATGFIHMDGYMDMCDAIGSRASLEKKRSILKDSHVGAFSVIALGCYFVLCFSASVSFLQNGFNMLVLLIIPVLSRVVSGLFLLNAPLMATTGLGAMFRENTKRWHTFFLIAIGVSCFILCGVTLGLKGVVVLTCLVAGSAISGVYGIKQVGGISGDVCGYLLTIGELCALFAMAFM